MGQRRELLAKYFSDISKLFFGTGIVKQILSNQYNLKELVYGLAVSLILLVFAYYLQPEE